MHWLIHYANSGMSEPKKTPTTTDIFKKILHKIKALSTNV